jgi:hypothetical protein
MNFYKKRSRDAVDFHAPPGFEECATTGLCANVPGRGTIFRKSPGQQTSYNGSIWENKYTDAMAAPLIQRIIFA